MPSTRSVPWLAGQQRWFLASASLADSGYPSVTAFIDALTAANPAIKDWAAIPPPAPGTATAPPVPPTFITIPSLMS